MSCASNSLAAPIRVRPVRCDSVLAANRDQAIRKGRIVRQWIGGAGYESIALFLGRYGCDLGDAFANACILERAENESTVLDYRPSRGDTILVASKGGPCGAGAVIKKVIGVEFVVSQELPQGAVKSVGSGL